MRLLDKQEKAKRLRDTSDYYMSADYIDIDGRLIMINQPSIDSTLYYDDEQPSPIDRCGGDKKTAFVKYNLRSNLDNSSKYYMWKKELAESKFPLSYYLRTPYAILKDDADNGESNGGYFKFLERCDDRDLPLGYTRRDLTTEEVKELDEIMATIKAKYLKRLETYYKRYNDKITTYGYWANR